MACDNAYQALPSTPCDEDPLLPLHVQPTEAGDLKVLPVRRHRAASSSTHRCLVTVLALGLSFFALAQSVTVVLQAQFAGISLARPSTFISPVVEPGPIEDLPLHPRPACPAIADSRYGELRRAGQSIYIAANLYNNEAVAYNWLFELSRMLRYLGPWRGHVVIYEDASTDRTPEVLARLAHELTQLRTSYTITSLGNTIRVSSHSGDPSSRVPRLAALRNRLLEPLRDPELVGHRAFDSMLLLNDVYACATDLLELLLQRYRQNATMICASDYNMSGMHEVPEADQDPVWPRIYDHWVLRLINGDMFYSFEEMFDWGNEPSLHPTRPADRRRWRDYQPVQALTCWNGAVALDPNVFLSSSAIDFRSHNNGSDQSECTLFGFDLWKQHDHGRSIADIARIAITPRVKLVYHLSEFNITRSTKRKEHAGKAMPLDDPFTPAELVSWQTPSPEFVSMPHFDGSHFWTRWDDL